MASIRIIAVVLLSLTAGLGAQSASELAKEARKAERDKQYSKAYLLYSEAAAMEPRNHDYWMHSQLLRTKAVMEQKSLPVAETLESTTIEEEKEVVGQISDQELRESKMPQPPRDLQAAPGRKDFDLRGAPKRLFEKVAKEFGLDVVFDGDFPAEGSPIVFRIGDVDYRAAIHALEAVTNSFTFPVGPKLFMAAKDTPQKRTEIEPTATVVIPIPDPVSVQEAQELGRGVQQTLEIPKFAIDGTRRTVMMRDRVSKVYAAQALFEQLISVKAQIMVEIEFMEIDESSSLNYGLSLPTQFPLASFGNLPRWLKPSSIPSGFSKFLAFGGGASLIGIGLTDSQLFASMTESNSKTIFRAQLRSGDGQPAQLHVGDRYPIATTQYIGGQVSSGNQHYAPPPSFNFEDLGIVIKVTPKVNGPREMTLAVESEFKVLAGQGLNGIPVISNRKFNSTLCLRDGEWAVIGGLVNSSEARTISGLYGLSNIPLLGPLVRSNTRDKSKSQVLIVIRPQRVGLSGDEMVSTRSFWIGSEARFASSL